MHLKICFYFNFDMWKQLVHKIMLKIMLNVPEKLTLFTKFDIYNLYYNIIFM